MIMDGLNVGANVGAKLQIILHCKILPQTKTRSWLAWAPQTPSQTLDSTSFYHADTSVVLCRSDNRGRSQPGRQAPEHSVLPLLAAGTQCLAAGWSGLFQYRSGRQHWHTLQPDLWPDSVRAGMPQDLLRCRNHVTLHLSLSTDLGIRMGMLYTLTLKTGKVRPKVISCYL